MKRSVAAGVIVKRGGIVVDLTMVVDGVVIRRGA